MLTNEAKRGNSGEFAAIRGQKNHTECFTDLGWGGGSEKCFTRPSRLGGGNVWRHKSPPNSPKSSKLDSICVCLFYHDRPFACIVFLRGSCVVVVVVICSACDFTAASFIVQSSVKDGMKAKKRTALGPSVTHQMSQMFSRCQRK